MFSFRANSKSDRFAELTAEASVCTRCPAMCGKTAVLSELNGSVNAEVLFIGEAPGRKGADRTRIPFSGDQSGENLNRYLASININREQIFITSAALCNPQTASGANRRPTQREVANCSEFLRRTIEIVNPRLVVSLGSVALEALNRLSRHELTLKEHAAQTHNWDGRILMPLFHPSPQVLASHRREDEQLRDYQAVGRAINLLQKPD